MNGSGLLARNASGRHVEGFRAGGGVVVVDDGNVAKNPRGPLILAS
jgi:hypothetical protein